VDKTLYINARLRNFISFLSTNTGFGNIIYKNGKATIQVVYGTIPIEKIQYER